MNILSGIPQSEPFDNDYANMIKLIGNITFDDENGGDFGTYDGICRRYLKKELFLYSV